MLNLTDTKPIETKEFFDCHGELRINFSKSNLSLTILYDHKEVQKYIKAHKLVPPRLIYQNLIAMRLTYNYPPAKWERDPRDDFRSAQMLVEEQEGYFLIEGVQEPGGSLAFTTPCFNDKVKYNRSKMTEIFIDSTFGTNKHGYELYCVLTELDLVSLPLSYLLDTRGIREEGKRGSRLTTWLTALRASGLKPTVVHTDKDFAEVTAASIAFNRDNVGYNHHLCLWHSLRAIDQYITGKLPTKGFDSNDKARNYIRLITLPPYLYYLSDEAEWILSDGQTPPRTRDQARTIRAMIKRHLLRHPLLPKPVFDTDGSTPPDSLQFQSYEEIHSSSIREMLEYCKSINQPRMFRYFWSNWGNCITLRQARLQCNHTNFAHYNAIAKSLEDPQEGLWLTIHQAST
ncbi:hypothetical protein POJ06DRAFT_280868 [Lipomyces tetrasporus]|uniref:MULE transposase domain-containing protein n=1 Tax=Lipomyces tetrasporus TaxID=54092 RepID=A0AAD7QSR0_9ASCO|nr:uncharacterized protein POJ06DRAFT_280868 [Lipomyces tetrasporus]KAJ8100842.1 hypothetical protein POJ06DRAFT_280868 [Lipomyces tetrasporus]